MCPVRAQSSTLSWNEFPPEIRLMILQNVADCEEDRPNFPRYATVSAEFQSFLEPVCFRAITFSNAKRMFEMDRIVTPARRRYVHTVSLEFEIKLSRAEIVTGMRHDIFFTMAVWQVFRELSTWEANPQGLKLELGAHMGPLSRGSCTYGCRSGHEVAKDPHVSGERWTPLGHDEAPILDFDLISEFDDIYRSLPVVQAVTSLAIRKQEGYHMSNATTILNLGRVLASLPRLREFRHDYWRGVKHNPSRRQRDKSAEEYRSVVLAKFSVLPCLRSVSIFEDFTCCFRDELRDCRQPQLAEALALSSRGLEELHLARNIDAVDFFSAFLDNRDAPLKRLDHGAGWPKMRFLSVTAAGLLDGDGLEPLLQAVAAAAETMPCLEVLELWAVANTKVPGSLKRRKHAGVFRYDRLSGRPRLALLTTWGGSISEDTRTAWAGVADKHDTRHSLTVEELAVCAASVRSHLDVLGNLILKDRLLSDKMGSEPFLLCRPHRRPAKIDPATASTRPVSSHPTASSSCHF